MSHGKRAKAFKHGSQAYILLLWCKRGREIEAQVNSMQGGADTLGIEMGCNPMGRGKVEVRHDCAMAYSRPRDLEQAT